VLKAENADKKLLAAKQSIGSGNMPLAQSDLKKVADQYAGTGAGAEAGMLLAQLKLDAGDNQGAVTVLTDLSHKVPSGPYAASIKGLLGDAYIQLGKPAEAAAAYEQAALATALPNERALLMSKLGRAWYAAGKNDKARETWQSLAAQQASPSLAAEARLRLGELLATTQTK
jgi:predicted negative regulator of RcsB-dependent stress response